MTTIPLLGGMGDEMSFKKLHIYVVTRIDLSNNDLDSLPFSIFQMESLKFLKLSNNQIKKLPHVKNQELDDSGVKTDRFKYSKLKFTTIIYKSKLNYLIFLFF